MASKARKWSNNELKKFAISFTGKIINVSGANDSDKEGDKYRNYFINANSYNVSNIGKGFRGKGGLEVDLETGCPELINNYDVVFNHTTLEHIFDFKFGFRNLCSLTNDILILVVPYIQKLHNAPDKSFKDYWRFTEEAIKEMCKKEEIEILYLSVKEQSDDDIDKESYIFLIASKQKDKWKNYNWN